MVILRILLLVVFILNISVGLSSDAAKLTSSTTAPDSVQKTKIRTLMPLKKGINLFGWFMGPTIYNSGHQDQFITASELAKIRAIGIDHVRLPVYGKFIANVSGTHPVLNQEHLASLDKAIQMMTSQKLAVIITLFPEDDGKRLATSSGAQAAYSELWKIMAARYKRYTNRQVYFDIMNEPHFQAYFTDKQEAEYNWLALQDKFIKAIRSETKTHTLITPVYDWDTVPSIVKTTHIYPDPKLVYTAHFYDPVVFVYQGSNYLTAFKSLSQIPYPITPKNKAECLERLSTATPEAQSQFSWYCNMTYTGQPSMAFFRSFVDWGRVHQVAVYLGEFGVPQGSSTATALDTQTWLSDVRLASEKYSVPWSLWVEGPERSMLLNSPNRLNLSKTLGLL